MRDDIDRFQSSLQNKGIIHDHLTFEIPKFMLNRFQPLFAELWVVCQTINFYGYLENYEVIDLLQEIMEYFSELSEYNEFDFSWSQYFLKFLRTLWIANDISDERSNKICNFMINHIIRNEIKDMNYIDANSLYQILLWNKNIGIHELKVELQKVIDSVPSSTFISKFQQDVCEVLKKHVPCKVSLNDQSDFLEKDAVVTALLDPNDGITVVKECKIAVGINGNFHYPRNSTKMLGKDLLKKKILEQLG